ncbi:NAD-dependent succinate-semialdehyde dehydrogenase [Pleionea sediminis]|uniref:NAD-dependent succinate-semialdehyde dehydrogenase n=1 Tax=Pleionea sediminis TaxID=2569479 RepID=UPI0011872634|nr:NAD-dependent succinate-semialdehyde dehydrogenase [Pleionea sediminis]
MKLKNTQLLKTQSFINGAWLESTKTYAVFNPADNSEICKVNDDGAAQVELAVTAARAAQTKWSRITALEKHDILIDWYQLIMKHQDDLATIMTYEQGKPLAESKAEIAYGAKFIQWYAEEAKRVNGEILPAPSNDRRISVIKQPIGVVGMITPWNFPSSMLTRKAGPALAAGCTVVARPASETPLSALALAELAQQAGIPDGVLNIVVGKNSSEMGRVLTQHPDIAKFSFTGSTNVGKKLLEQCASTVKKVSLELGGNAPFIVFDDAKLDKAVEGALASKFRNTGQTCVCANRILVQSTIYDKFCEQLTEKVKLLKMGNGMEPDIEIGPMINRKALSDVNNLVKEATQAGAEILIGGSPLDRESNFFQPTLIKNVSQSMSIAQNEIFGPVAPIISFDTEDEAIALANDTRYGLAAYFYARDIGRCYRVMEQLEYGMVGINAGVISNPMAPFGGVKESGIGREGSHYGIEEYLEVKYACFGDIE